MDKIISFLDGKKSYIGGTIVFIAGGLKAIGVIDDSVFQIMISIGGAISVWGLRAAIKKL